MLHARPDRLAEGATDGESHFVYVVDDEAELRKSACFLLVSLGLACVHFSSGEAFLDEVPRLKPGCILLDLRMQGRNGLAVQQELSERGVDWPIIFMSGDADGRSVVQATEHGAVEFIKKPFSEEELLAALHRGFVVLREVEVEA
jgi:two-component system, LuxR family, response regulator FixJ